MSNDPIKHPYSIVITRAEDDGSITLSQFSLDNGILKKIYFGPLSCMLDDLVYKGWWFQTSFRRRDFKNLKKVNLYLTDGKIRYKITSQRPNQFLKSTLCSWVRNGHQFIFVASSIPKEVIREVPSTKDPFDAILEVYPPKPKTKPKRTLLIDNMSISEFLNNIDKE